MGDVDEPCDSMDYAKGQMGISIPTDRRMLLRVDLPKRREIPLT